uniref:Uncharacterized protein n=1 Tax=Arundo donax TaxID=35708 RepID=A0A0A9FSZ5_ARUDO
MQRIISILVHELHITGWLIKVAQPLGKYHF